MEILLEEFVSYFVLLEMSDLSTHYLLDYDLEKSFQLTKVHFDLSYQIRFKIVKFFMKLKHEQLTESTTSTKIYELS